VAVDLLLFVFLAVGFVLGRLVPSHGPWVGWATQATIVALVASLGFVLSAVPLGTLAAAVPLGLGFALVILGATIAVEQLWVRGTLSPSRPEREVAGSISLRQLAFPPVLVAALLVGLATGRWVAGPAEGLVTWTLDLLLFLVGFDLRLRWTGWRSIAIPTVSAGAGALAGAAILSVALGLPLPATLSVSLAFGWYSLAGPLVAQSIGPAAGLLAFLANFFRENATMLSAPALGRQLRGEGLAAMGGATSMDTTLYFITRYGDPEAGTLALSSGLVLTLAAAVLVPLFAGLAG